MKIKNYKKKFIIYSISLIIIGFAITILGMGFGGFNIENFKEQNKHNWYKTVQIYDDKISYGIKINDKFSITNFEIDY